MYTLPSGPTATSAGRASAPSTARPPSPANDREQFFAKLAPLGEEDLRKALWNLYWRGNAAVRQRIEAELQPPEVKRRPQTPRPPADPGLVSFQVEDFVALARSGAYIGGDRRVSPKERTRWRFVFRKLMADARDALRADDDKDFATAVTAMVTLLDFACELKSREYFRSEDPIEAAKTVISDEVAVLWSRIRDHLGVAGLAEQAAPQLIRWEQQYGWTRSGWGATRGKETSLARVIERMLPVPDAWDTFVDQYLAALDEVAPIESQSRSGRARSWYITGDSPEWLRTERTKNLAEWHELLIDRLAGGDDGGRLDRLANHSALGGPERTFLQARLAHRRGQLDRARRLIADCLSDLPGHRAFIAFAQEIGASLPPRTQEILDERAWFEAEPTSA